MDPTDDWIVLAVGAADDWPCWVDLTDDCQWPGQMRKQFSGAGSLLLPVAAAVFCGRISRIPSPPKFQAQAQAYL